MQFQDTTRRYLLNEATKGTKQWNKHQTYPTDDEVAKVIIADGKKIGIKPQTILISDNLLRTSAVVHIYKARARRNGYRMLISVYILCDCTGTRP